MPKSRSRKHKIPKKRHRPQRPTARKKVTAWAKWRRRFFPHFLSSWRIAVVVLGVIGSVFTLYSVAVPRITVSSSHSLNPSQPFQTYFELRNDGYFAINRVTIGCAFEQMSDPRMVMENTLVRQASPQAERIEPGGVATIRCPIGLPTTEASTAVNMVMIATFRADYSPIETKRGFRFVTARSQDGTLRWQQQPE